MSSKMIMSIAAKRSLTDEIMRNKDFEDFFSNHDVEVSSENETGAFSVKAEYDRYAESFMKLNDFCLNMPNTVSVCWHKSA